MEQPKQLRWLARLLSQAMGQELASEKGNLRLLLLREVMVQRQAKCPIADFFGQGKIVLMTSQPPPHGRIAERDIMVDGVNTCRFQIGNESIADERGLAIPPGGTAAGCLPVPAISKLQGSLLQRSRPPRIRVAPAQPAKLASFRYIDFVSPRNKGFTDKSRYQPR